MQSTDVPMQQNPAEDTKDFEATKPKHTIYINNLNDKIKIEPMKQSLHAAFSQFGPIVDIVMRKRYKLRGQAFIIFQDVESASKAVKTMKGFPFYEKPMNISFSKTEANVMAKKTKAISRPALT